MRERLENWGRFWRDGKPQPSHCRSIEHRYVPERLQEDEREDRAQPKREAPDWRDAELVNEAWRRCTRKTRLLLTWLYSAPKSYAAICKRLQIREHPPHHFVRARHIAEREIALVLDNPLAADRMVANSTSTPALAAISTDASKASLSTAEET